VTYREEHPVRTRTHADESRVTFGPDVKPQSAPLQTAPGVALRSFHAGLSPAECGHYLLSSSHVPLLPCKPICSRSAAFATAILRGRSLRLLRLINEGSELNNLASCGSCPMFQR